MTDPRIHLQWKNGRDEYWCGPEVAILKFFFRLCNFYNIDNIEWNKLSTGELLPPHVQLSLERTVNNKYLTIMMVIISENKLKGKSTDYGLVDCV